jgi:hypothetical protein
MTASSSSPIDGKLQLHCFCALHGFDKLWWKF